MRSMTTATCMLTVACWCGGTSVRAAQTQTPPTTSAPASTARSTATSATATTGVLGGIVRRPDGQVAPHLAVFATNEATGATWTTTTSSLGLFAFSALPPGRYRVEMQLRPLHFAGFVDVIAGRRHPLDVVLKVQAQEIVEVRSGPSLPISRRLAATFNRRDIDRMPLANGQTVQSILALVPAVVFTESFGTLAQFTAIGQSRFSNRLSIDGIAADLAIGFGSRGLGQGGSGTLPAMTTSGGTQTLVTLAAVDEIQVRTVNASAQYAQTPGAQTILVTRSGENRFSGTGFVEGRPSALMASDWFANAAAIPPRRAMAFGTGFTAGGPIVRSRLLFFGSFERQRIERTIAFTVPVPSLAARESASGALRAVLDAYPVPNGDPLSSNLAALSLERPVASKFNAFSLRLDAKPGRSHKLFTRIQRGISRGDELTDDAARLPAAAYSFTSSAQTTSATAGWNAASGAATFELRANVTHHAGRLQAGPAEDNDHTLPFHLLVPPDVPREDAFVTLSLFPGPSGTIAAGRLNAAAHRQIQFANTVGYLRGRHKVLFGANVTLISSSMDSARVSYGYRSADIGQFLESGIRAVSIGHRLPARIHRHIVAMFVQDTWRAARRLTLDYGMRYNVRPPPVSATVTEPLLLQFEALPELQPRPSGARLWQTSWQDLNPHLVATYQLGSTAKRETTLQSGISIVTDDLSTPGASAFGRGYPYVWRHVVLNTRFPPRAGELSTATPEPFGPSVQGEVFAISDRLRTPHTYQWQLGVEQKLGDTSGVALVYLGSAGRRLVYWQAYQPAGDPTWLVHAFDNTGYSDYHALMAELKVQVRRRVTANVTHTWSHALDIDSGEEADPRPPVTLISPAINRGNADFDRRHVFRAAVSISVPVPPMPDWLRPLGSEWTVDLAGTAGSGAPVSVTVMRNLGPGVYMVRPDALSGEPLWIADPNSPTGQRINSDAFVVPTDVRAGTVGRNTLRGSPFRQLDLGISRSIALTGRASLKLRIDAFNVFNIPNFGPPVGNLEAVSFGRPIRSYAEALGAGTMMLGGLSPIQQAGGQRAIQLAILGSF